MKLSGFVKPVSVRVIAFNICQLLILFAIILSVPLVVSIIAGEFNYTWLTGVIAITSLGIGFLGKFIYEENIGSREAILVTAFAYLIYSILGAFIFLPVTGYLNGFFESMSGFTTTGLSVLNPEKLPDTLIFFRAYSQWIGGAGIIVLTLVILISPGVGAIKLYSSEFGEENLVGDVKNTGKIVIKIYSILTVAGFWVYFISGVSFLDSILYVFSTVSTGGFAPYKSSTAHYPITIFHIFVIIFMIFGATSFSSFYKITESGIKGFFDNVELKYLLSLIFVFTFIFYITWDFNPDKIISSFFQSTTSLTTTGFTLEKTSELPVKIKLMKIFLMITGGTSASTAGGIKLIRLILMVHLVRWMILNLLLPGEAKIPVKVGNYTFGNKEIKQIFSFFSVYLLIVFISSLIFIFYDYNSINSIFECSSALGTVGLSTGITSASLPAVLKIVLIIEMWAGRLEIFPLIALLYPRLWIPKGGK